MDLNIITASRLCWVVAAGIMAFIVASPSVKRISGLPRLGKDPGRFHLRAWFARMDFLRKGSQMVYQSYHGVSLKYSWFIVTNRVSTL